MAVATQTGIQVVLKYADKGTFRYGNLALTASNQQLYALAGALNSFQKEPNSKLSVIRTSMIV